MLERKTEIYTLNVSQWELFLEKKKAPSNIFKN